MANKLYETLNLNITAHSGGGNASAVALSMGAFNVVSTSAAHGDSVSLSDTQVGLVTSLINKGAKDVGVYPPPGGTVDGRAANAAYYVASGSVQKFLCTASNTFICLNKGTRLVTQVINPTGPYHYVNTDFSTTNGKYTFLSLTAQLPPSAWGHRAILATGTLDADSTQTTFTPDASVIGVNSEVVATRPADIVYLYQYAGFGQGKVFCIMTTTNGGIIYSSNHSSTGGPVAMVKGWEVEG